MKRILIAFPVIALAVAFSFCAKEPVAVEATQQSVVADQTTSDRSPCDVSITATGLVRVCGLASVGAPCLDCLAAAGIGETGVLFNYNVNSPGVVPFSITNLTPNVITVTVTTVSTNAVFTLKPGACKRLAEFECAIVLNAN